MGTGARDRCAVAPRLHLDGVVESKAFHICPFCRAPSPVSEQRCARCGRSLAGLPLEIYGFETDAALAHPLPKPLMDLPLREQEAAGNDGAAGPSLYCAVIVKRVDEKTRAKTSINELLRD